LGKLIIIIDFYQSLKIRRTESNIKVNSLIFNAKTLAGFALKMHLDRFNEENILWRRNPIFIKLAE